MEPEFTIPSDAPSSQTSVLYENEDDAHKGSWFWSCMDALRYWFTVNTFTPTWMFRALRYWFVGYVLGVCLQVVTVIVVVRLLQFTPAFRYPGLLAMLLVGLLIVCWGPAPSLITICLGTILLPLFVFPLHDALYVNRVADTMACVLFLLVGVSNVVVASKIERARRQTERLRLRLDAIIDAIPDGVTIYNAKGVNIRLNTTARLRLQGEHVTETIADTALAYRIRTPADQPFPIEQLPVVRALHGEAVSDVEANYQDAMGEDRTISMSAAPFYNAKGVLEGVVVTVHDISALRRSEEEAMVQAKQLQAIFDAMTDGVIVYDSEERVVQMNTAMRMQLGLDMYPDYQALPLEERKANLFMRDETGRPLAESEWPQHRLMQGEVLMEPNTVDVIARTYDGRDIRVSVSGAPIYDQEGHIAGAVAVCRDVTQRRYLEQRTKDALQALLNMAEALVQAPTMSSLDSTEPSMKSVAQRLGELTRQVLECERVTIVALEAGTNTLSPVSIVGFSPEQEQFFWKDLAGRQFGDWFRDDTLVTRLHAGQVLQLDLTQPASRDQVKGLAGYRMLVVPIQLGDQLIGAVTLHYIDGKHHFTDDEISLAQAVARLAALSIERERLLAERAEARLNELASRKAQQRMEEFLNMASHELRTPITTIKGSIQLTRRWLRDTSGFQEGRSADLQNLLVRAERQVGTLNRLVGDLLDVSRIQANRLHIRPNDCDLTPIVRNAVYEQAQITPARNILLEIDPDCKSVPVIADAERIGQVISSYLTNALKYSEADCLVEVRMHRMDEDTVKVLIRDEGPGLSAEEQQQIWERFSQLERVKVRTGSSVGLGLGLHISRIIIEQHQGQVGVDSVLDEGSTFWFTLPISHA